MSVNETLITTSLSDVITSCSTVMDFILSVFGKVVDLCFTSPLVIFVAIGIIFAIFRFAGGFIGLHRR